MNGARLLLISALMIFTSGLRAQSVTDGVLINADFMDRDLEKKMLKLNGHVQLVFKGQHLSCDSATLDLKTQKITAEGHVILYSDRAHIEGDKLAFNYSTSTGYIYNGFVQSGQVVFEGETVEKVGEDHYIATNASYTACETCPPGWSFSGRKIDAEIGGYARIQRPVFRVGGVPVLILPSLIVPLKSRRQSGVLVPSMGYSNRDGVSPSGVYFWAISPSQDLTLTARWYRLNGYKVLADYRYVLDKNSAGQLKTMWMQDKLLRKEIFGIPGNIDRWFVSYDHLYELPDNYVQRMNIKQVSDLRYTRDYPDEISGHGEPALENRVSITKSTDNQYASAEVDVYTNMLKQYPLSNNDDAVHRFPEMRYSVKEQRLGGDNGPLFHVDLDYVNFVRQSWDYDNLTYCVPDAKHKCKAGALVPLGLDVGDQGQIARSGTFNRNTDLFRTGQRLDIQPTISYPFQIARRLDLMPSVTYRETQYRFSPPESALETGPQGEAGFNQSAARRYVQTDFRAKTEFSRVFSFKDDPKAERLKHSFEPEVGVSQILWSRTPNHPFFGQFQGLQAARQYEPLSDGDIGNPNTGVQFDYNDRTFDRRVMNFAATNRITRKTWNDGTPDYRTLALFQVGQSYDLREAERPNSYPWSSIDALLDMRFEHFVTYTTVSYNPYAGVANTSSRVRVLTTPKNFAQLSFTQGFILDNKNRVQPDSQTRNFGVGGGVILKYIELEGMIDFSEITHKVQSWHYGMNIRPPGNCWVIHLEQTQVVQGTPQIHAALSFDFGGETKNEATTRTQAL